MSHQQGSVMSTNPEPSEAHTSILPFISSPHVSPEFLHNDLSEVRRRNRTWYHLHGRQEKLPLHHRDKSTVSDVKTFTCVLCTVVITHVAKKSLEGLSCINTSSGYRIRVLVQIPSAPRLGCVQGSRLILCVRCDLWVQPTISQRPVCLFAICTETNEVSSYWSLTLCWWHSHLSSWMSGGRRTMKKKDKDIIG